MDSINREQPEDNRKDIAGQEALERIRDIVKKTQTCFFCTVRAEGPSNGTRPMKRAAGGRCRPALVSERRRQPQESRTGRRPDGIALLSRLGHSDFLHLTGRARIVRDPVKLKELWEPVLRTWFTGGIDDPRITMIELTPTGGYYWDNKHGNMVAGVKMLIGAATGKTLDDSIEGRISP